MQLMTSGKKVESRQLEVSEFSRQIKLLAKELEIPVVALSQLNRGPEQRTDKKPMMSDLRESGSLEQDADVVILLHRGTSTTKNPRAPARPTSSSPNTATDRRGPCRWSSKATIHGSSICSADSGTQTARSALPWGHGKHACRRHHRAPPGLRSRMLRRC